MRPERLTTESPLAESSPADQRTEGSSSANGWEALAGKLAQDGLTSDDLMAVEALAWRASKAGCAEVESACVTVICALQGNWGKPPNAEVRDPAT